MASTEPVTPLRVGVLRESLTTGVLGCAGGAVSTEKTSAVVLPLALPAASVALKLRLWAPSASALAGCQRHWPWASTCTVVTRLPPSSTVRVLLASAVPENTGWASRVNALLVCRLVAAVSPRTLVTVAVARTGVAGGAVSITSSALEISVLVTVPAVVLTCTL